MKNDLIYFALALITGALIPIQAATNAVFSKSIGNPSMAGLMVFVVGLVGVLLFILILYSYLGGIIVATYVIMITVLVPKIGVGPAIALIVTGQIICAVTIDHFGLFNVAVRHISITRMGGIALMIGGIYLVTKK